MAIGLTILLFDIVSKWLVTLYIPSIQPRHAYPFNGIAVFNHFFGIQFALIHNTNKGAAWGILPQWQIYLLALRIAIILVLSGFFAFFNKRRSWDIPLACIIAGATGNVLDYFFYGHVIDMFHFVFWGYNYPTFNVADSSIFIGVVWLFFSTWKEDRLTQKKFFF
jgi:signal peptidase II